MQPMDDPHLIPSDAAVLRIEGLTKRFGGVVSVDRCSLTIAKGSITGLIGPNGSGKTTLFNLVTGLLGPDAGRIRFLDRDIVGLKPHAIHRLGMSRTFQITRLFPKMTVLENLRVATPRNDTKLDRGRAGEFLELMNLWNLRDRYAEDLSYGQAKLLELARALISNPALVMLDEPFAGINRVMAAKLVELVHRFRMQGTTFFLIDHEMKIVMEICDPIHVMDFGVVIAQGRPQEIRANPQVLEAYFGR